MPTATIEVWIIGDPVGEYVEYYNPTGHVMVFTRDRDKARQTTDSEEAFEISRIARSVYGRRHMGIALFNA